ncbi:hypothetical protein, partial [Vreelandella neptunia]|uniref:hypothetical protein n=1 Tax=Vreelandella neptunia TaxID=115551 RepID=UPI0025B4301A
MVGAGLSLAGFLASHWNVKIFIGDAWAAEAFLSVADDIPLMSGLTENTDAATVFDKPAGEQSQGRILVRTKTGQPVQFDAVELTGPGLTLRARATLPQGGGWSAEVTRLKYGDSEVAGKVAFAANGDTTIDMAGKRYDLQPFLKD